MKKEKSSIKLSSTTPVIQSTGIYNVFSWGDLINWIKSKFKKIKRGK
ncbi:MAG: hypothetical protein U9R08_05700 [Nanoarchaeota archaeon]|nr:hypothetical protein [Nanoarchaeota archaeon]